MPILHAGSPSVVLQNVKIFKIPRSPEPRPLRKGFLPQFACGGPSGLPVLVELIQKLDGGPDLRAEQVTDGTGGFQEGGGGDTRRPAIGSAAVTHLNEQMAHEGDVIPAMSGFRKVDIVFDGLAENAPVDFFQGGVGNKISFRIRLEEIFLVRVLKIQFDPVGKHLKDRRFPADIHSLFGTDGEHLHGKVVALKIGLCVETVRRIFKFIQRGGKCACDLGHGLQVPAEPFDISIFRPLGNK